MVRSLIKHTIIIISSAFICTILHGFLSIFFPVTIPAEPSFVSATIGFPATSFVYFILAYICIAYVFHKSQAAISSSKIKKGITFGFAMGLIWFWGMLENFVLFESRLIDEIMTGFSDLLPIIFLCVMIAVFCLNENDIKKPTNFSKDKFNLLFIMIFAVVFCVGRYVAYFLNLFFSNYNEKPYITLIWTLGMGICIAVTRFMLREVSNPNSIVKKSFKFGIILFGVNWCVFNGFIPFFLNIPVQEIIIRVFVDIALVVLCCYFTDTLEQKVMGRK